VSLPRTLQRLATATPAARSAWGRPEDHRIAEHVVIDFADELIAV
jgi:hypothetical protein